jgi:hypothetical protein
MTGDGIYVTGYNLTKADEMESKQIIIKNNTIFACRRQGISVTGANGMEIFGNEIREILGVSPQSCIDLEINVAHSFKRNSNIAVYDNTLIANPEVKQKPALIVQLGCNNITITNNDIIGFLELHFGEQVLIESNRISDGGINAVQAAGNITDVTISNNTIRESLVSITFRENFALIGNGLHNSRVEIRDSDVAVVDNQFTADREFNDAIWLYASSAKQNSPTTLFFVGNEFDMNYKKALNNGSTARSRVNSSREDADAFHDSYFNQ